MASEEASSPPPLPSEEPPAPPPLPPPPTLSPPPSTQMSSPFTDWLDFDPGVGGHSAADDEGGPPLKKARLLEDDNTVEDDKGEDDSCLEDDILLLGDAVVSQSEQNLLGAQMGDEDSLEEGEISDPEDSHVTRNVACIVTRIVETAETLVIDNASNGIFVLNEDKEDGKNEENQNETVVETVNASDGPLEEAMGSEDDDAMAFLKQQFEIIDDLGGSDDELNDYDSDDLDEEQIDALLDEGLQVRPKGAKGTDEDDSAPVEREKAVLKEISKDPFDILPEGWVMVTHDSGMPVYLHKDTRVCTFSRPYFLGSGSARRHDIPLSAIPCFHYARELKKVEEEKSQEEQKSQLSQEEAQEEAGGGDAEGKQEKSNSAGTVLTNGNASDASLGVVEAINTNNSARNVQVASVESYKKEKTLDPVQVRKYCEQLFQFDYLRVKKYRTWKDRREHHKMLKHSRPILPSNTKLITCPLISSKLDESMPNRKKEFILNPAGKTEICILHEYVQHSLRVQPKYIFRELENATTPYSATVVINEVEYGTGYASSKKAAKNEAAKATLAVMIPELCNPETKNQSQDGHDLSFFDEVKIEDPRVHDLCNKAGQPSPFQILCECLRRNFGMGDTNCKMEMKTLKHQKSEFVMQVGKHTATVGCKNKREGKQLAAQAILQLLHPRIRSWGSLLRLYGNDWRSIKEKEEEVSVTALHAKAKQHQPNRAILTRLRQEMKKLQMRRNLEVPQRHGVLDALNLEGDLPDYSLLLLEVMVLLMNTDMKDGNRDEDKDGRERIVDAHRDEVAAAVIKKEVIDASSQTETSSKVLVMKEGATQAGQGVLAAMVPVAIQAAVQSKDEETQIETILERTWEKEEAQPMDVFVYGLSHYHVATQTHREGEMQFHKATQYPDVLYTPDQSNAIQVPECNIEPNRIRILSPKPARHPIVQHQPKPNPPPPGMMYMPRPRNVHYIAKGRAYLNSGDENSDPPNALTINQSATAVPRTSAQQPLGAASANINANVNANVNANMSGAMNPHMPQPAYPQSATPRPQYSEGENYPMYPFLGQQQYYQACWPPQQGWPWQ